MSSNAPMVPVMYVTCANGHPRQRAARVNLEGDSLVIRHWGKRGTGTEFRCANPTCRTGVDLSETDTRRLAETLWARRSDGLLGANYVDITTIRNAMRPRHLPVTLPAPGRYPQPSPRCPERAGVRPTEHEKTPSRTAGGLFVVTGAGSRSGSFHADCSAQPTVAPDGWE